MKTSSSKPGKSGFVSYVLVLTTGAILTMLMVFTYRQAMASHAVQSQVQLRNDYSEKEDAILRSIVAIVPNRAILAMQDNSNASDASRSPMLWQTIFSESLEMANARTSISSEVEASLNIGNFSKGNATDSSLGSLDQIFKALNIETGQVSSESGYVTAGINANQGSGFPPTLSTGNDNTKTRDKLYPIITNDKMAPGLAAGTKPNFEILKYPKINFGYAKPGDYFLAKRNWWAFSLNVSASDAAVTKLTIPRRDFVLSIYEIPSQLAISASSFMSLGKYASGDAWQNVTIEGGVFAGKAEVDGGILISNLSSRRSMTLSDDAKIGQDPSKLLESTTNPFAPGVREKYQVDMNDEYFPVSLSSESGRVAFIPINRGKEFFDRFHDKNKIPNDPKTLSPTHWNNYSVGALQCAMRLDIMEVSLDKTPTKLRFSYLKNGIRVDDLEVDLNKLGGDDDPPISPWIYACNENQTYNFRDAVVDVAYGKNGVYRPETGVTGSVTFNNARFGDPLPGVFKSGYYKPSYPFEKTVLPNGQHAIKVYPQRFKSFLAALNADNTSVNNSLVVNVDYTTATGSINLREPSIPSTEDDYAVVLEECADLRSFSKGFSLVSNLRTFFGDDFNIFETPPPSGYTLAAEEKYYPPCSIFVPEKRYGVEVSPYWVSVSGQVGSLAKLDKVYLSDDDPTVVSPLDSKNISGTAYAADRVKVNLRPITHPAALPPITMMNWLVVLEEKRRAAMAGY